MELSGLLPQKNPDALYTKVFRDHRNVLQPLAALLQQLVHVQYSFKCETRAFWGLTAPAWHSGTNHIYPAPSGSPINAIDPLLHAHAYTHTHSVPTCRTRMCSCPTVVSVLPVGRAVGGVAILAVLLAIGGPVLVRLPTVCHACLLGHRGGGQVTCWSKEKMMRFAHAEERGR